MKTLADIKRRYYCGAPAAYIGDYSRETMGEAIERAAEILAREPRREEVTIVKVVAVVRRAPLPIVVETFDGEEKA